MDNRDQYHEQQQHRQHSRGSRIMEKQRKMLTRELRELQSDPQATMSSLSREERRIAAAAAARQRLELRTGATEKTAPTASGQQADKVYKKRSGRYPILYDEHGIHCNSGRDLCDCLDLQCPGCHVACKSCGSEKCGRKCRVRRKWMYTQAVEQNPFEESMVIRTKQV